MGDLRARHGLDRVVFESKIEDACVYAARFAAGKDDSRHWTFMAVDGPGCTQLDRPFLSIDTNDARALGLVQSLVFGSRKAAFAQALRDKALWDLARNLDDAMLAGTFRRAPDGALRLAVPGGTNTLIRFTSIEPLQITIERWQ
jgi:hypothetical protein